MKIKLTWTLASVVLAPLAIYLYPTSRGSLPSSFRSVDRNPAAGSGWKPEQCLLAGGPDDDRFSQSFQLAREIQSRIPKDLAPVSFSVRNLSGPDAYSHLQEKFNQVKARAELLSKKSGAKIEPLKFKNLIARRFINREDWEKNIKKGDCDPRTPYGKVTWESWLQVAETGVDDGASKQLLLTSQIIKGWNRDSLQRVGVSWGRAGEYREGDNATTTLQAAKGLNREEREAIMSIRFPGDTEPAVKWESTHCQEEYGDYVPLPTDLSNQPECDKYVKAAKEHEQWQDDAFWQKTAENMKKGIYQVRDKDKIAPGLPKDPDWYLIACYPRLTDAEKLARDRHCGMFYFVNHTRVPQIVEDIVQKVNAGFDSNGKLKVDDPVAFATEMQILFVALHPFPDGNGRTSRWIMDYITTRAGLPPIIIKDQDLDLSVPAKRYALDAREGMLESIKIMSDCLDQYEKGDFKTLQGGICGMEP